MNADFPRILTLLRKEKGISQKEAAANLGISQALLSHYEKGIRECGLDFLLRCSDYYGVSCDYLLGKSPERNGAILSFEDIPEPENFDRGNIGRGVLMAALSKKLIANSLNILFDLLSKADSRSLTNETAGYLMLCVYKAFRLLYQANSKNESALFNVPAQVSGQLTDAACKTAEANISAALLGVKLPGIEPVKKGYLPEISTESLMQDYPQMHSSLLNLIQNTETRITNRKPPKKQ